MEVTDLNKHDLQPLAKILASEFSIFAIDIENPGGPVDTLEPLKSLMEQLDLTLHDHPIDFSADDYRMYMGSKTSVPRSFYQFGSHMLAGRMPFLFYRDEQGKILGGLLKLEYHTVAHDDKVINKLIHQLVESTRPTANPISHKEAKRLIQDEVKSGKHPEKYPVIETCGVNFLYFDFEHQRILVKNSSRNAALSLHSVMFCNKVASQLIAEGKNATRLKNAQELTNNLQPHPTSFAQHCISKGETSSPYRMDNLVKFYAESKDISPVQATDTAELRPRDQDSQKIMLKNSLSTLASRDIATEDHFQTLQRFASANDFSIESMDVCGEIRKPWLIRQYLEAFPEGTYDAIEGDYISLTFATKSVTGNIAFSTRSGMALMSDAAMRLINKDLGEGAVDFNFARSVCSKWFGAMLGILHQSSGLFVECYKASSKTTEPKFSAEQAA